MQIFSKNRTGNTNKDTKNDKVSAQKFQTGVRQAEKTQKNRTIPPAAPSTMNPRSSPAPRSRTKPTNTAPTARQYPRSQRFVSRGNLIRNGRSRSYSTPAEIPSRIACPNSASCCDGMFPILTRRGG